MGAPRLQCEGTGKRGGRCRARAAAGSAFCYRCLLAELQADRLQRQAEDERLRAEEERRRKEWEEHCRRFDEFMADPIRFFRRGGALETLGLADGATADEVKAAFRRLALLHHPDRGGDAAKFREMLAAYEEATR
jgi:hypothetical protein